MINLLRCQLTVSCLTQMRVDGGDNCHAFGYKHLLYDFLLEKSVKVADISTFWDACIGLVPIIGYGAKHEKNSPI